MCGSDSKKVPNVNCKGVWLDLSLFIDILVSFDFQFSAVSDGCLQPSYKFQIIHLSSPLYAEPKSEE